MGIRSSGREAAFQMIFALENGEEVGNVMGRYWRSLPLSDNEEEYELHPETKSYAEACVSGYAGRAQEIDEKIQSASLNWRLERMTRVDRTVLRLGAYELFARTDVPSAVIIDEAVELAKRYGTSDSSAFVNGVLDRIAQIAGRSATRLRMELHFISPELRRLDELPTEALACGLYSDALPPRGVAGLVSWRLAGRIDRLLDGRFLTGRAGEVLLLPGRPRLSADKVLLFGLGPRSSFDERAFDQVADHILRTLVGLCIRSAVIELPGRHDDALAPEQAADRFLANATHHDDAFDSFTLVEEPAAQRRINQHMIEERRRVRRF